MAVRAVVLLNLGNVVGGFRIALRAGALGLDRPDAFEALERTIQDIHDHLQAHQPSQWPEVAARRMRPRIEGREINLDLFGDAGDDRDGAIVFRACLPFRIWPSGGWVVYDAWHRTREGSWTPFTEEELAELW